MTTREVKRKLTTILSADVKGYSRLIGEDEEETIHTLNAYKEAMSNLIQQQRGRVVDAPGDNVLAEFGSVVDALRCAVDIQKELKNRNVQLPENRRMEFRIGVNLGDVVEDGEQILGDGVNIAARVQGLADGGGICISGTAYDHVENKLSLGYEYLGEQSVKNIAKPVRVYKVLMEPEAAGKVIGEKKAKPRQWQSVGIGLVVAVIVVVAAVAVWRLYLRPTPPPRELASKEKMAFPLPDKPSIAVLPFVNMSEDPKQDLFSDGITEEIINALSKVPQLFVIARNSTFVYKGKATSIRQVAEDLGVQYVLEGSVRRSGDVVRVTAQLIDAIKGHHLWSERYDRSVKDIFALQDEITMKVLTDLRVKLTDGETARIYAKGTKNLQAYLKVLEGDGNMRQYNKEANAVAMRLYQEAIKLDPNYAMAYTRLSRTYTTDLYLRGSGSPKEMLSNAMKLAQKAIELDNSLAEAHAAASYVFLTMREHDKAIEAGERAVTLNPNSATALFTLATCLFYSGRCEEALPLLRQAIRLNPFVPIYYTYFGSVCRETGRYQEGIAAIKKSLKFAPNDVFANVVLAILYVCAGLEDEARAAVAEVMRIDPTFSVESYANMQPWKEPASRKRLIDDLREAGLK